MGDLQGKAMSTGISAQNASVEKMELFADRVVNWWNTFILQYLSTLPTRDTPYEVLIVGHGGWIGTLVRTLVNSRKLRTAEGIVFGRCPNVSVTRIEMEDNRNGSVAKYADISHLPSGKCVETNADGQFN